MRSSGSFLPHVSLVSAAAMLVLTVAGVARAQEAPAAEVEVERPAVTPDRPAAEGGDARYQIDRTSLYGDDARIPLPLTAIATSSFSYTNVGSDPTQVSGSGANLGCRTTAGVNQPCYSTFSGNTAQPGGTMIITGEVGIITHLSLMGNVMVGAGGEGGVPSPDLGGTAALRFQVFPDSWTKLHFVISGGYVREAWNPPVYQDDPPPGQKDYWIPGQLGGVNGAYFQLALSGDIGRFRAGGMFHGQHTFADGRDPLDLTVDLYANYRIYGGFRAGLEYVGQDLEESFSPGAEGGARHFLGPVAALQVWHDRVTILGGPGFGLSYISPDFVARVAASVGF
jgi:hypothetical protein